MVEVRAWQSRRVFAVCRSTVRTKQFERRAESGESDDANKIEPVAVRMFVCLARKPRAICVACACLRASCSASHIPRALTHTYAHTHTQTIYKHPPPLVPWPRATRAHRSNKHTAVASRPHCLVDTAPSRSFVVVVRVCFSARSVCALCDDLLYCCQTSALTHTKLTVSIFGHRFLCDSTRVSRRRAGGKCAPKCGASVGLGASARRTRAGAAIAPDRLLCRGGWRFSFSSAPICVYSRQSICVFVSVCAHSASRTFCVRRVLYAICCVCAS